MATILCKHNPGVGCEAEITPENEEKICGKCGWNPKVCEARKAKLNAAQFIRDANAPTSVFIISGAVIVGNDADPVSIRVSKSPQGNLVLKLPGRAIVVPGKTVMEAMRGKA